MEVTKNLGKSFVNGTVEGLTKITGGKNTMKENNTSVTTISIINTAEAKLKRAVYSETITRAIIKRIKDGATSHDIELEFNVKERSTIKKWLDRYFTKKKAVRDRIYKQLLTSDANVRALAAKVVEGTSSTDLVTSESPSVEITFEEWFEGPPEYDYLIDDHMLPYMKKAAVKYAEKHNCTFAFSHRGSHITIQAIVLGKPTIMTDNASIMRYCAEDEIPYFDTASLVQVHAEEDLSEFSRAESFESFRKGSNGVYHTHRDTLISEFSKKHGFAPNSIVKLLIDDKPATAIFGLKDGKTFKICMENPIVQMCYCWTFQLSNGTFYETSYKEGHIFLKAKVMSS